MKKTILYLLETFPQIESEVFILNEINGLKKLGNEIYIKAFYKGSAAHKDLEKFGILKNVSYLYRYRNKYLKKIVLLLKLLKDFFTRPILTIKHLNEIMTLKVNFNYVAHIYLTVRDLPKVSIDTVQVSFADLNFMHTAKYISSKLGCGYTIVFRAIDIYKEISQQELTQKRNIILPVNCKLVTISQQNREVIKQKYDLQKNIYIVHDAINPDKFLPINNEKENKFITVARFLEKKGVEYLLEAYAILLKKGVVFNAVIIGDGPLKDRYIELINKLKICDNVIIKPPMSQENIVNELASSMMFVLPCVIAKNGDRDILANVLKEAMSMEIPVITTDVSGINELVENDISGILIPPHDSQSVASAIEQLYDDATIRKKLGKNAREKIINDFNIQVEIQKLNVVLDNLVRSKEKA